MSNIFKFYINNNNKIDFLYLFIKNKYLENNEGLQNVVQLNDNYSKYEDFKKSDQFIKFFTNDFSEQEISNLDM